MKIEAPIGEQRAPLADGGSLAYEVQGRALGHLPLLLLRPLGGSTRLWGPFLTELAHSFQVIAFDHRGTGHSSESPAVSTTRQLAEDAAALLAHLGVARAHVFGLSLGGMAATWLALQAPERVGRLCLASTPPRGTDLTQAGVRRGLEVAACFAEPDGEVEASLVQRVLSRTFRDAHPDRTEEILSMLRDEPSTRVDLLRHAAAGAMHDAGPELHRVAAPTLVLAGDHDHWVGEAPQRELASAIPGATFDVIAGAGHDLSLEQPLATAARLTRFLTQG